MIPSPRNAIFAMLSPEIGVKRGRREWYNSGENERSACFFSVSFPAPSPAVRRSPAGPDVPVNPRCLSPVDRFWSTAYDAWTFIQYPVRPGAPPGGAAADADNLKEEVQHG